ncbi:E3 ubiquitin-protein ligase MARCH1-like isoform X1 [Olea europaea var. sylvestris]|uniref:E3 ubiquitin-protein ligase MARCH1-like isoform X1 n=1 Tax=Olea europaea var. sylvestris TaxID=158386 RepID=UPI000C1CFA94|nr:E3 ubiquitin-protein ligase MARCH1-like isoform X1 [Olea europaea var. sylvestris]XP_022876313.1 E3 ubiquitin-protein ligase MARCH1-like isoform X1 [Olea europaea var. sylvestris]
MEDFEISIDDLKLCSAPIYICRICHEQEFETSKNLETPCACSGTVKFAHRDCIQRWCNEKGNTICEICLQKYEPGYTAPSKKSQLLDTALIIRGSSEIPRREREEENGGEGQMLETDDYSEECSSASHTSGATCWRSVALIFTFLLLMRHLLGVLAGETADYPFSLFTLLIARAIGILLPMYILLQLINKIQNSLRQHNQSSDNEESSCDDEDYEVGRRNNIEIRHQ